VVIPAAVRSALVEHAEAEKPNEACGLVALRGGVAEGYYPCINDAASPFRFELRPPDPNLPFALEERGYDVALFHSHLSSPPRPSRTDVENIGHWSGLPYLILALHSGELGAWRIEEGRSVPLELSLA
jgi:[CysO sulfur-carrier protein]-S-L-cysteine hydrolase